MRMSRSEPLLLKPPLSITGQLPTASTCPPGGVSRQVKRGDRDIGRRPALRAGTAIGAGTERGDGMRAAPPQGMARYLPHTNAYRGQEPTAACGKRAIRATIAQQIVRGIASTVNGHTPSAAGTCLRSSSEWARSSRFRPDHSPHAQTRSAHFTGRWPELHDRLTRHGINGRSAPAAGRRQPRGDNARPAVPWRVARVWTRDQARSGKGRLCPDPAGNAAPGAVRTTPTSSADYGYRRPHDRPPGYAAAFGSRLSAIS